MFKSELDYFSKDLQWNWARRSERISERIIDIGDRESVDRLKLFSLVGVESYRRPFTSHSTVQLKLSEAHFESAEWAASFENDARKEKVSRVLWNKSVLKARFWQQLLDTRSARKRTAWDMVFQLLRYQKLVSTFCASSNVHLCEKKAVGWITQEWLLKRVKGSVELEMSW